MAHGAPAAQGAGEALEPASVAVQIARQLPKHGAEPLAEAGSAVALEPGRRQRILELATVREVTVGVDREADSGRSGLAAAGEGLARLQAMEGRVDLDGAGRGIGRQDAADRRARQPPYRAISPGTRISVQMILERFACTQATLPNR